MKFIKNRINIIISLLIVIMIVLILFSSQRFSKSSIEGLAGDALNPIQKIIHTVSNSISNTYKGILKYSELVEENQNIKKENGQLKQESIFYDQLKHENERLREMLNFKNQLGNYEFIGVNIIGKTGGPYVNNYIVDLGQDDGFQNGMVVVSNGGLFGVITSVSDNWSIVSPIINGSVTASGVVQRTNGSNGIVKGHVKNDDNILKIEYFPIEEDVVEKDVIVTSGLGGVYPANIPIGEVVSIEVDNRKMSKNAYIRSYVDFEFPRELFVILPKEMRKVEY